MLMSIVLWKTKIYSIKTAYMTKERKTGILNRHTMKRNIAFIDGQNLRKGTLSAGWEIDFKEFRKHLLERYSAGVAYYFFGCERYEQKSLYANIENAGFALMFGNKSSSSSVEKDGDVDTQLATQHPCCVAPF